MDLHGLPRQRAGAPGAAPRAPLERGQPGIERWHGGRGRLTARGRRARRARAACAERTRCRRRPGRGLRDGARGGRNRRAPHPARPGPGRAAAPTAARVRRHTRAPACRTAGGPAGPAHGTGARRTRALVPRLPRQWRGPAGVRVRAALACRPCTQAGAHRAGARGFPQRQPGGRCRGRAVLDWELPHLGDPMEGLGWFCVNAWRFGAVERPAGGFGSRAELFAAYEAAGGVVVNADRVRYWEVLGNLKWGIACDAMGLAWRSGQDRAIERLAIGRRATEVEVDLLQLLAPQGGST